MTERLSHTKDEVRRFVAELRKWGVVFNNDTVSHLLSGTDSGARLGRALQCAMLLDKKVSISKLDYYGKIAEVGKKIRRPQRAYSQVYTSVDFVENLAKDIPEATNFSPDIDPALAVRQSLRAMAADFTFTFLRAEEGSSLKRDLRRMADQAINAYYTAYLSLPPSQSSTIEAQKLFDTCGSNASKFMRNVYEESGGRRQGTWTAYSVDMFADFYDYIRSHGAVITPFDVKVLTMHKEATRTEGLINSMRELTGVRVDSDTLSTHTNVLLLGFPVYFR